jgi:hypothetical protein
LGKYYSASANPDPFSERNIVCHIDADIAGTICLSRAFGFTGGDVCISHPKSGLQSRTKLGRPPISLGKTPLVPKFVRRIHGRVLLRRDGESRPFHPDSAPTSRRDDGDFA